ncbi:MAG: hypothetical protein JWO95_846 [Verrucomicrobiales bacterium]|nr:hypothetical protein [Verrucomicrobiales bacterium]
MHTQETRNKFIELRVEGLSYEAIAQKLNVSKQTLLRWANDHDSEIRSLRAAELDAIFEKIFASPQVEAIRLANLQTKLEDTIAKRQFTIGSHFDYIKSSALVRKEIREFRKNTVDALRGKPQKAATASAEEKPPQPPAPEAHPPTIAANPLSP